MTKRSNPSEEHRKAAPTDCPEGRSTGPDDEVEGELRDEPDRVKNEPLFGLSEDDSVEPDE